MPAAASKAAAGSWLSAPSIRARAMESSTSIISMTTAWPAQSRLPSSGVPATAPVSWLKTWSFNGDWTASSGPLTPSSTLLLFVSSTGSSLLSAPLSVLLPLFDWFCPWLGWNGSESLPQAVIVRHVASAATSPKTRSLSKDIALFPLFLESAGE